MGIMVYSLLWVVQDLYHQQYATEIWKLLVQNIRTYQFRGSCSVILNPPLAYEFYVHLSSECCFFLSPNQCVCVSGMFPYLYCLHYAISLSFVLYRLPLIFIIVLITIVVGTIVVIPLVPHAYLWFLVLLLLVLLRVSSFFLTWFLH